MSEMGSIISYAEDLSDAEAPKGLPANDYPGEIVEAVRETSKSSGKENAVVTWRIKPEDFPADFSDAESYPDGMTVKTYQSTEPTKAARYRMRKFCEAIGAPLGSQLDLNDWVGKTAILTTAIEPFEGVEQTRVRRVSAA